MWLLTVYFTVSLMTILAFARPMANTDYFSFLPFSTGGEPHFRVSLQLQIPPTNGKEAEETRRSDLLQALHALGYDVHLGSSQLFLSKDDFSSLSHSFALFRNIVNVSLVVEEEARPLRDKFEAVPAGYRSLQEIEEFMNDVAARYPAIAKVYDIGALFGVPTTYEGRQFYAIKISDNVEVDEDEENILIQGLHHSREIITPEICLDAINRFTSGYGVDSNMTYMVDNFEIWIWPAVNPDGLDYVWDVNNMWRKNRKPSGSSYGVDNNRNYDLGWDSSCGGSTIPSSDTYRGPYAHSEEENQLMAAMTRTRNFRVVADFHSYGREVLYNYLCNPMPSIVESFVERVSNDVASYANYATRYPSADGGHCQWTIKETTLQCFLFETETEFQPSYQRCLAEIERLWPALLNLLMRPSILNGHIYDASTGAGIVGVNVNATNVDWQMEETRLSSNFGRYHYALPSGNYNFVFSAAGYISSSAQISLNENQALTHNIYLNRNVE